MTGELRGDGRDARRWAREAQLMALKAVIPAKAGIQRSRSGVFA